VPVELGDAWHDLLVTMTSAAPADRPDAQEVRRQLTALAGTISSGDATRAIRQTATVTPAGTADDDSQTRLLSVPLTVPRTVPGATGPARSDGVSLRSLRDRWEPLLAGAWAPWALAAALLVLLLVVTVALLAGGGDPAEPGGGEARPTATAPTEAQLPPEVTERLADLRDAVEGR
jgi:hypothetical protein